MIFHVQRLREIVRSAFNQASVTGHLSTTDIDLALNESYMSRVMDLINAHEGYFEEIHPITLVANQENYELPKNFNADQKEFIKTTVVQRKIGDNFFPLNFRRKYDQATISSGSATGDGYLPTYHYRGRDIIFDPPPNSAEAGTTRMVHSYMPPRLRSANVGAGASTTTPETIIRLDSGADSRNDYYIGARVMVVSGNTQAVGETRLITDYNGRTKEATVAAWVDFDGDPSTVNPKNDAIYSILLHDDFPEVAHELIALDAVVSGYLRERASSLVIADFVAHRLEKLEKRFFSIFENRTDQPKFTRPWHIELDG